ncbi:MAG: beta-lactamase family protein [Phycisphaerales bacterium]|nr:beta-lactamase family protein [Phycisphaerales bacterium]
MFRHASRRLFMAIGLAGALLAPALAGPALAQGTAAPGAPDPGLEARLDWIAAEFEKARAESHAPGAALAVVQDGKVVFLRGFGVADVDTGRAVTPDTRFAVGSTTKAFTATLIGMLSDDGLMSYDESVHVHLPGFHINDKDADAQATIRDLLCHRTGFAVMNAVWYGVPGVTRQDVLDALGRAELLYPFRQRWNYSNESFLAAGMAAANAAGSDWDTLVRERIFKPVGMTESNTTYSEAQADPEMAQGYVWHEDTEKLEHQPMRRADAIAPAGSINSSVRDMSRWVLFQLGRGEIDGKRLLSEATHAQTWTKASDMNDQIGYALGWMLRDWEGKRVIEHAGGIDGFTAEVAMLPDDGIGMVMLTNQFASPLQEMSRSIVFRGLEGDISESAGAAPAEDFSPLLGDYTANFGPFKDATMKVLVQNGHLAIDVPGQMVFEMRAPDAEGKRPFLITDTIALRFNDAEGGKARSLTFFQNGMTFECFREGEQAPVEIDLAAAQDYLGVYHVAQLDTDVTVLIQNNRLAIDQPGQMVYELCPPDADGWMNFRISDALKVRFDRDASGKVVSMTQTQNGVETLIPRTGDRAVANPLPTIDQVMEWVTDAGLIDTKGSLKSLSFEGTIAAVNMGLSGPEQAVYGADGRQHTLLDLGGGRITETWIDGDSGLSRSFAAEETELSAKECAGARIQSPMIWATDWRKSFDEVAVAGRRRVDGHDAIAVLCKLDGAEATILLDAESHLPLAVETTTETALGGAIPITVELGDWREVGGVRVPFRQEVKIPMAGTMRSEYTAAHANVALTDELFRAPSKPEPAAKVGK